MERFQPRDGIEFAFIEEMVAAHWRQRRAWAIETHIIETQSARAGGRPMDSMSAAFRDPSLLPALALMHRYEGRLHSMYQRALRNFLLVRELADQNEPSPNSGHSAPDPGTRIDLKGRPESYTLSQ